MYGKWMGGRKDGYSDFKEMAIRIRRYLIKIRFCRRKKTDRWTDRRMDGQKDRQMDRRTDRWTDRQRYRWTDELSNL